MPADSGRAPGAENTACERGVVFSLHDRLFALPLEVSLRVLRAVEITPVPQAPPSVAGVIDVHGEITPVIDLRERFGVTPCALVPGAQFLLVASAQRAMALWVDCVNGVASWGEDDFVAADSLLPGVCRLRGMASDEQGLILVHDLDALLSPAEEAFVKERIGHDPG